MISRISNTQVEQKCGVCGNVTIHAIASLSIGFQGSVDADHFAFPQCATCGAREFARREGPSSNPDEFDSEHCGAVNALHRQILDSGSVAAALPAQAKAQLAQEKAAGKWPKNPRRLFPVDATLKPVKSSQESIVLPQGFKLSEVGNDAAAGKD